MSDTPVNALTQQPLTKAELTQVSTYGNEIIALGAEIATIEALLTQKKERVNLLEKTLLPAAMTEVGLSAITLANGAQLAIVPFYQCSMSDEYPIEKDKALKWLRTNKAGALIKHEFKCALGVESEKEVASLRGFLNRKGIEFKDGQSVHAAKLKSFMKERIEGGKPFPMDIFRAYHGKVAKVSTK